MKVRDFNLIERLAKKHNFSCRKLENIVDLDGWVAYISNENLVPFGCDVWMQIDYSAEYPIKIGRSSRIVGIEETEIVMNGLKSLIKIAKKVNESSYYQSKEESDG